MAQCMFPYYVEQATYYSQEERFVPVPCGKCPECLKRRTASWAFRLEKEAELWSVQKFITLTYSAVYVPLTRNKFMTLWKRDLQLYFKRLRKRGVNFKYYGVGEYGTQRKRPHYHLILFGDDTLTDQVIYDCWKHVDTGEIQGNVYYGKVESGSIRYCVQYYDKGDWRPLHSRDDREQEFSVMSKGLGKNFLTESMQRYLLSNPSIGYLYEKEGRKIAIPRYYKKRMYQYEGTEKIVRLHPSFLVHRDERKEAFKAHSEALKRVLSDKPVPEETRELFEARRAAILNYRQSKRKTRD